MFKAKTNTTSSFPTTALIMPIIVSVFRIRRMAKASIKGTRICSVAARKLHAVKYVQSILEKNKASWENSGKLVYMVLMSLSICLGLQSHAFSVWQSGDSGGCMHSPPRLWDAKARTRQICVGKLERGERKRLPIICWWWQAKQGSGCFCNRINCFWLKWEANWFCTLAFHETMLPWRESVGETTASEGPWGKG